jgi:hypothetical protein
VYQLQKNANKKVIELCYVAVTITSLVTVKLAIVGDHPPIARP